MASEQWERVHLGDLVDIRHGYAFDGRYFRDQPPGNILLTPGNFAIGGGFQEGKLKYYDGPVPSAFVLDKGDLLVSMTDLSKNGDTLGYPAFVPESDDKSRYLHNQRLGKVVVRPNAPLDVHYLYFVLRTRGYRDEILSSATGSTVRHTSPDRIRAHEFFLPPLPEQRAIARILGALDDKIELNRRMNETLEAIARALFQSWFVNFDPVRVRAEGRQPAGVDAATAALFPDAFEASVLGPIPQGWEVRPLDSIARFLNGLAMQKYPPRGDERLPVIKIADLRRGNTEGSDRAGVYLDPDYIVEDGDVLFSWSGSLESVVWCGGRGALNQHLFKVTSSEFPKWLYFQWIRYHLPDFQATAAGKATTMGHIQRHHLTSALVVVPPPSVVESMNSIMQPLLDQTICNNVESRALAAIRDALLPKLLSGAVRVGEAQGLVEEVIA